MTLWDFLQTSTPSSRRCLFSLLMCVAAASAQAASESVPSNETLETLEIEAYANEGKPVTHIEVHPLKMRTPGQRLSPLNAVARPDAPAAKLKNKNGRFTVPNPCLISTRGSARVLLQKLPGDDYTPPIPVWLGSSPALKLLIKDYHGRPVSGAVAGLPLTVWESTAFEHEPLPVSNEKGEVLIQNTVEGDQLFAVTLPLSFDALYDSIGVPPVPRLILASLKAGKRTEMELTLPLALPDTPEAQLVAWERRTGQQSLSSVELSAAAAGLNGAEKSRIAELVVAQLRQTSGFNRLNTEQALFFVNLAATLDEKQAIPEIARLLQHEHSGAFNQFGDTLDIKRTQGSLAKALWSLQGDQAVPLMAKLIASPNLGAEVRTATLFAMGNIGTPACAKAFAKLRDTLRTKPGAPPMRKEYTHAQKMAEAVVYALNFLIKHTPVQPDESSAWVDAQYEYGRIRFPGHTVQLRRAGNEWLLTDVQQDAIE